MSGHVGREEALDRIVRCGRSLPAMATSQCSEPRVKVNADGLGVLPCARGSRDRLDALDLPIASSDGQPQLLEIRDRLHFLDDVASSISRSGAAPRRVCW